jgi:hypothetical protein
VVGPLRLCRLNGSYPYAAEYVKQMPRPVVAVLARCCSFLCGSIVAVLLLFALIEESILLYVKLFDRNLLWWVLARGIVLRR